MGIDFLRKSVCWATVFFVTAGVTIPAISFARSGSNPYAEVFGLRQTEFVSAKVTGDPRAIAFGETALAGFPQPGNRRFLILSTGKAADAYLPDLNNNEMLNKGGMSDDRSTKLIGKTARGSWDLVQVAVTVRPPRGTNSFSVDYAFFTEEWPEYYGAPFNDTFLIETVQSDFAVRPSGMVDAPGNVAFDMYGNKIGVKTGFGLDPAVPNPDTGTTYDGTTGMLTTRAPIPSGTTSFTIILTLFDVGDPIVDSAVFLGNIRFWKQAVPEPITEPTQPGGHPGSGPNPADGNGKVTMGGTIPKASFGGVAMLHQSGPRGSWEYNYAPGKNRFHGHEISSISFYKEPGEGPDVPKAEWNAAVMEGTGELNGEPGYTFTVWAIDRGEPGLLDTLRVQILDPEGQIVVENEGVLTGGNIQIHPPTPDQ